jgi:hypothetical protein
VLVYHAAASPPAGGCNLMPLEAQMVIARYLAVLATLTLFVAPGHAQDGGIKIEKFTHSEWTRGVAHKN